MADKPLSEMTQEEIAALSWIKQDELTDLHDERTKDVVPDFSPLLEHDKPKRETVLERMRRLNPFSKEPAPEQQQDRERDTSRTLESL